MSDENKNEGTTKDSGNRAAAYAMLFFASFFWGFQSVPVKFLLAEWSAQTIVCVRYFLLSGILFAWIYHKEGTIIPPPPARKLLMAMGIILVMNTVMQTLGVKYTTITNATLISATNPVNTAVLSFFILRERIRPLGWVGILMSFSGVLTVVSDGNFDIIANAQFGYGDVISYIGVLLWGFYAILAPRAMKYVSAEQTTAWTGFAAAWLVLLFDFYSHQIDVVPLTSLGIICFLFSLICGGLLANVFFARGINIVGPTIASQFGNILPLVGIVSGYFIMGDELTTAKIIGAILVLTGVRITVLKK